MLPGRGPAATDARLVVNQEVTLNVRLVPGDDHPQRIATVGLWGYSGWDFNLLVLVP